MSHYFLSILAKDVNSDILSFLGFTADENCPEP
jgi:hypothetical protein